MGKKFDSWSLEQKLFAIMFVVQEFGGIKNEKLPKSFVELSNKMGVGDWYTIYYPELKEKLKENGLDESEIERPEEMFKSLHEFYETHWQMIEYCRAYCLFHKYRTLSDNTKLLVKHSKTIVKKYKEKIKYHDATTIKTYNTQHRKHRQQKYEKLNMVIQFMHRMHF